MANKDLLKGKIYGMGYTVGSFADVLGITRQMFYKKVRGDVEFRASEIKRIHDILQLSVNERDKIFFNFDVDDKSTSKQFGDTYEKLQ